MDADGLQTQNRGGAMTPREQPDSGVKPGVFARNRGFHLCIQGVDGVAHSPPQSAQYRRNTPRNPRKRKNRGVPKAPKNARPLTRALQNCARGSPRPANTAKTATIQRNPGSRAWGFIRLDRNRTNTESSHSAPRQPADATPTTTMTMTNTHTTDATPAPTPRATPAANGGVPCTAC